MNRSHSFADSTATPTVNFTEIPADIVQDVQIATAQSRAMTGTAPAPDTQVFFSESPPDMVQAVQVVATASSLSFAAPATPAADLPGTIAQLRGRGVADDEIRQFLQQIGSSYTFSMSAPTATVILPNAQLLTKTQSELLLAAISTQLTVVNPAAAAMIMPLLYLLPEVADRYQVSIGIGPAVTGAAVGGGSLSAGILFAPGHRIGVYGSLGAVLGAIVSISLTMQVTIVHGGPELFGGTAFAATIGGGEGVVGSASALLSDGKFIGVTFAMGVGAGVTPIEAYIQYQYTATAIP